MQYKIPPGVFDIIPHDEKDPWKNSFLWNFVEKEIRKIASEFGFHEIRTPIFERTELFQRSSGETSDIVSKEMYTFVDKGKRLLSLRPEGTAPAIRAFIENNLANQNNLQKLFYIAPMFRYERSQAGRYRQHHQFGVEAIGCKDAEQDVEVISMVYLLYQRLGLKNLNVCINTLGDEDSRLNFKKALVDYLSQHKENLSEDSLRRLDINPLRILDSKDSSDKEILINAPSIHEFLNDSSKEHFEKVKELLTDLSIPFTLSSHLVRGLDYYNHTVFEITSGDLGSQNSIVGGGRYDGLIKKLGGPDLPAFGFGTGIERIIQTMLKQMVPLPRPYHPLLYLIPLDKNAKKRCFKILYELREKGIPTEMDFSGRKLGKVMQYANQLRADYVAVVGEKELEGDQLELKEMSTGLKHLISFSSLPMILKLELNKSNYLKVLQDLSKPLQTPEEKKFYIQQLNASIQQTNDDVSHLEEALKTLKQIIE